MQSCGWRGDPNAPPQFIQAQLMIARRNLEKMLAPIFPYLQVEPFLFADDQKVDSVQSLAEYLVNARAEVFYSTAPDGDPIGVQALVHYRPWKWSYYMAWCNPRHRSKATGYYAAKEVIDYAFQPYPAGGGQMKLRAEISTLNYPAMRAAARLGFQALAVIDLETWYNGQPHSMLIMDLYNPQIVPLVKEVAKHDEPSAQPEFREFEQLQQRGEPLRGSASSAELREPVVERGSVRPASGNGNGNGGAGNGRRANVASRAKTGGKPRPKSKR